MRVLNGNTPRKWRMQMTTRLTVGERPGLPVAMEKPILLRSILVVSIVHLRRSDGPSREIEQTDLIHKLTVLEDIKQQLASSSAHGNEFLTLVIARLSIAELAAGDADAAEAHMRFAFSSRETNPFDQVKQLRERTTLITFCILRKAWVYFVTHGSEPGPPTPQGTMAFILMHLLHEFLLDPELCVLKRVPGVDVGLLRWLVKSLRDCRDTGTPVPLYSDLWIWQTAVSAYALIVGSVWEEGELGSAKTVQAGTELPDPPAVDQSTEMGMGRTLVLPVRSLNETPSPSPHELGRAEHLKLSTLVEEWLHEWTQSPRMVQWAREDAIFDKIEWFKTDEGLNLLEYIIHRDSGVED
ncbi:uncharacterized protein E0L32_002738 [Thyridium curvatum]|uniref:Uncharacterized protein n=1 Tax=Thyridium curvatum TaxID=1093900 RepID=A0A507BL50_9PEZI|nr:uncharacterized protein E0L32_002738 [Thyridium curvatum]TPX18229.1 hypothetical protein E0L32_002738 [Thyridium curvatum]